MLTENQSRDLVDSLLKAVTSEDVLAILKADEYAFYFNEPQYWKTYGGREKNWDTVGNQQGNAVGALLENIVNGIDSVLLRASEENGLKNPRSPDAPKSMAAAVERYFNIPGGKLADLPDDERTALAEKCVSMSIKRGRKNGTHPTYTIADHGTGQVPVDFPKTFLSLSERNKEGIGFVQGKFNMGSTGVLRFCTRCEISLGHHKLIVSKHYKGDRWGWTILRVRPARDGEALPVAEYFYPGQIPTFRQDEIFPFHGMAFKKMSEGTIVKLFEVDIGAPHHAVDFGMYNALSTSLITTPLPIRTYDLDATPVQDKGENRKLGIAPRTIAGLYGVLKVDEASSEVGSKSLFHRQVVVVNSPTLGRISVMATGLSKMEESLEKQSSRVFFTINGQKHASLTANWLNNACQLGDVVNNLIINVDCTEMGATALTQVFMPDRERMVDNSYSTELKDRVKAALKGDTKLAEFAAEIRLKRAQESLSDNEEAKELLKTMARTDPSIKDLFGFGADLPDEVFKPKGTQKYSGKKFPTFLEPLSLRPEGDQLICEIPINSYRRIECTTDASNDYLSRSRQPGSWWCSEPASRVEYSSSLNDGHATFTIYPPDGGQIGQELDVAFGFMDGSRTEPLTFTVTLRLGEAHEKKQSVPGKKVDSKEDVRDQTRMPEINPVKRDYWASHGFTELSGSYVSKSDAGATVYVNVDHKALVEMRTRVRDEAKRVMNENIFRTGLGIFALALQREGERKALQDVNFDTDRFVRDATSSVAPYFIPVVVNLANIK